MKQIEYYVHDWGEHSARVAVLEGNKGLHKANCLCFQRCRLFRPGEPNNCIVAQSLFDICVTNDVVTPVWECSIYEEED